MIYDIWGFYNIGILFHYSLLTTNKKVGPQSWELPYRPLLWRPITHTGLIGEPGLVEMKV